MWHEFTVEIFDIANENDNLGIKGDCAKSKILIDLSLVDSVYWIYDGEEKRKLTKINLKTGIDYIVLEPYEQVKKLLISQKVNDLIVKWN